MQTTPTYSIDKLAEIIDVLCLREIREISGIVNGEFDKYTKPEFADIQDFFARRIIELKLSTVCEENSLN